MIDAKQLRAAYRRASEDLLAERNAAGSWVGQLSSSSLSTATAISALAIAKQQTAPEDAKRPTDSDEVLIRRGLDWLAEAQNSDGGWGDTDRSYSNIATSMLVVAAIRLSGCSECYRGMLEAGSGYVKKTGGIQALKARFGKDQTFSVPILTNSALAGSVPWKEIPALPFELACIPQSCYRWARMPVVSYAIPALVAIGQAHFIKEPPRLFLVRWIRAAAVKRSLSVLLQMQPRSGGYLEAVPLTSFVVMSLAATGRQNHRVTESGLRFLRDSARPDGSWPIDTNLATWTTTLAIKALSHVPVKENEVFAASTLDWLLKCQHTRRHPFTGADPGGWGWTDLSGAVPDVDDTSGALLALAAWMRQMPNIGPAGRANDDRDRVFRAATLGIQWLLDIQNRDGGWPTFCRGWGKLPFDRSGADLTAHALQAIHSWQQAAEALGGLPGISLKRQNAAIQRGLASLGRAQNQDGSWLPLWFGNQDQPGEENPVYGTSRVLQAFGSLNIRHSSCPELGYRWLLDAQLADGGWSGGPISEQTGPGAPHSSVEETAVAVEALATGPRNEASQAALNRGLGWLINAVTDNRHRDTSPIGFYFAKLWYYERLYPLLFSVAALGRAVRHHDS